MFVILNVANWINYTAESAKVATNANETSRN